MTRSSYDLLPVLGFNGRCFRFNGFRHNRERGREQEREREGEREGEGEKRGRLLSNGVPWYRTSHSSIAYLSRPGFRYHYTLAACASAVAPYAMSVRDIVQQHRLSQYEIHKAASAMSVPHIVQQHTAVP
eukprot:3380456-Rhodomonas_salina.1